MSNLLKEITFFKNHIVTKNEVFELNPNSQILGVILEIGKLIYNSGFSFDDYLFYYQLNVAPQHSKIADLFDKLELEREMLNNLITTEAKKSKWYHEG